MKLRIKGDSLRLRVSPSEVTRLLQSGRVEETIHFGKADDAKLTYAILTSTAHHHALAVRRLAQEIAVIVPLAQARAWAGGEEVGMYSAVDTGAGQLELAVEKDFACLGKSDGENRDTYPHPDQSVVCERNSQ